MSQEPPILAELVCRKCGAHNPPHANKCWLCNEVQTEDVNPYAAPPVLRPINDSFRSSGQDSANSRVENVYSVVLLFLFFLAIVVGIGLGLQDRGFLMMYIFVIGPAFLATGLSALFGATSKEGVKASSLVRTFIMSTMFAFGVIGLLIVAVIISFFIWCGQLLRI